MALFDSPAGVPSGLSCPVCKGKDFETRRGVLDTRDASFFGLTWANRGSTALICRGCMYVMTFADRR